MHDPYVDQTQNDRSHILTLRVVLGFLLLIILFGMAVIFSLIQEPEKQRISIPPQLNYGAEVTTGEIQSWEVYSFAGSVYQQLNLWRDSGETDFEKNLASYSPLLTKRYLTAKYKEFLLKKSRNELNMRTRSVAPLGNYSVDGGCGAYSDACVQPIGANRWKVWLDIRVKEFQHGKKTDVPYPIKDLALRIPLLVVMEADDPEKNPWGLKVDQEFTAEIEQIDMDAEREKMLAWEKEQEKAQKEREGKK